MIDKLLLKQFSVSLCPYYHIKNEYRIIVLDNEIRLIFGKIKPFVIGDGIKNLDSLAKEINYLKEIDNPNYIPKLNEKVELSFKFNLSSGGKTFLDIPSTLKDTLESLALEVSNKLNIFFASIDIIVTNDNKIMVLEANSGVTLNNFVKQSPDYLSIVYNIYKDAIKLMFNKT